MALAIDLSGKTILICGASRGGISGATARTAAVAGAQVVIVDKDQAIVDETLADVRDAGGQGHGLVVDLLDPAQTDPLIESLFDRFGRIDGIANVAGGTTAEEWMPLEQTPTDSFRRTLNLNLEYVFRLCRDYARALIRRKQGGAIVNVGSVSALTSAPWHGPYGAAKSGISALTRTMAFEWQYYGIRANTVSPGGVMSKRVMERPKPDNVTPGSMRDEDFATTAELANSIVFLLSDLAGGVSGQTLVVDRALSTKFCAGMRERGRYD